jgi:hypothetical protein
METVRIPLTTKSNANFKGWAEREIPHLVQR